MPLYTTVTPGASAPVDGEEHLFFSGFSYLGLHVHPAFKAALQEGIAQFGTVFISSRAANLQLRLYKELESALAMLLQQPAAATFSSGYLASQAAARYAGSLGQKIYAPGAHPALQTGHFTPSIQSWQEWTGQTIARVNAAPDNTFVIMADAVNPLTSTQNNFTWLQAIHRQVTVLIDDSHGLGILGDKGQGIVSLLPQHPFIRYLISASLAKAYSTQGGVIAGAANDISAIKKQALFTASTPMMPANAWAWLQSGDLHTTQRLTLKKNISLFQSLCPELHNPHALPVFLLPDNRDLEQLLLKKNIIISSFSYPYPDSPPVNRTVITALHTPAHLQTLSEALRNSGLHNNVVRND